MPSHGPEISYEKRVAVITLRLLAGDKFSIIAQKLNLYETTVYHIFTRAVQRTEPHLRHSFEAVVRNCRDTPRSGRPAILPQRSAAAIQLRQLFLKYFDLLLHIITNYIAGIKMTRSTAERIAHKHRDPLCDRELVRVIQPIKSCLPYDLRDLRVEFAHWIMQKMENNTCFHMWLRKKPKMTSAEQGVRRHARSIILSQDRVRPPLGKKEERKTRSFDRLIPHLDYVPTGSLV